MKIALTIWLKAINTPWMQGELGMIIGLGTALLETERLQLRRFRTEDIEDAFHNWCSDPRVTPFLKWRTHLHIQQTEQALRYWIREYSDPYSFHWAIVLKATGQVIGGISLGVKDRYDECGELGYSMGSRFWGKGLGTEAAQAVLRFGFVQVGFHRIEGICATGNSASAHLMKKLGMVYEGCHRDLCRVSTGAFVDCDRYAILCEDYYSRNTALFL